MAGHPKPRSGPHPADPAPVTIHENLTLLEVERPEQLAEVKAMPEVRAALVREIRPTVAVLDPERLDDVLSALEKHGYLPHVEKET